MLINVVICLCKLFQSFSRLFFSLTDPLIQAERYINGTSFVGNTSSGIYQYFHTNLEAHILFNVTTNLRCLLSIIHLSGESILHHAEAECNVPQPGKHVTCVVDMTIYEFHNTTLQFLVKYKKGLYYQYEPRHVQFKDEMTEKIFMIHNDIGKLVLLNKIFIRLITEYQYVHLLHE